MSLQRTYRVQAIATPDAVDRALARARLEGYVVVAVIRVGYVEEPASWDVTLAVRRKGLVA